MQRGPPKTDYTQQAMLLSNDLLYLLGLMDTIDSNNSDDDFDAYLYTSADTISEKATKIQTPTLR